MALRVLHVLQSLVPEAGSVAICLRGLLDALRAQGVESQTLSMDPPAAGEAASFQPGHARTLVERADVVHVHGWGDRLSRTAARAARRAHIPYVVSPLGGLSDGPYRGRTWPARLWDLAGDGRLLRHAAAVTAVNELEQRALCARRANAHIVPLSYGVTIGDYEATSSPKQEQPAPPDGRYLLMLSPLHPVEGFVPLLKALAEIGPRSDGWNVVLAGKETGNWRPMLEAAIRRKGGEGRVRFVTAPDLPAQRTWLSRASALAAPSLHVRCPVSVLQALCAGVPAMATTCAVPDGLEDVVRVCGPTRGAIKTALRSLLSLSEQERSAMARRGGEIVRARFDWSVLVDEYLRLYRSLRQRRIA